ncbi:hypothetical protein BJ165DRAFT_1529584 [Panaeolus papilionaceus]|nr:hypothetical protein BJ165DRAFT_1529584 [Panaeolus papilionaceus]
MVPFPTPDQLASSNDEDSDYDSPLDYEDYEGGLFSNADPVQWKIFHPGSEELLTPPPSPSPPVAPGNTPTSSQSHLPLGIPIPNPQQLPWLISAAVTELHTLAHHMAHGEEGQEGSFNPWPESEAWRQALTPDLGLTEFEQYARFWRGIASSPECEEVQDDPSDPESHSSTSSAISEAPSFDAYSPSPPDRTSLARTRIRRRNVCASSSRIYVDDDSDSDDNSREGEDGYGEEGEEDMNTDNEGEQGVDGGGDVEADDKEEEDDAEDMEADDEAE